ncbi:MAG TPA: nucleoside deaminase, partial [Burkholderiaceae bacterium]|nr:nucleoside deaminase [Burkholderiaceae bacterium]
VHRPGFHRRRRLGLTRRAALMQALWCAGLVLAGRRVGSAGPSDDLVKPERRWYEAAASMKRLAESLGDQPYGAVLVANGAIIGQASSRVVTRGDATAHAEREAIADAQRALGRKSLAGSVLYSTSRPCRQCEMAAAEARVARMIFGEALDDAGPPRP